MGGGEASSFEDAWKQGPRNLIESDCFGRTTIVDKKDVVDGSSQPPTKHLKDVSPPSSPSSSTSSSTTASSSSSTTTAKNSPKKDLPENWMVPVEESKEQKTQEEAKEK